MKKLPFDFLVDKENNTIYVKREFDAGLTLVWKAWTTAEILDQWWAPKPWRAETKSMDFREGGYWHYAMVSPEGDRHWSKAHYLSIEHEKKFVARDGFCDENGTMNSELPQNNWENRFTAKGEQTEVSITLLFDRLEDLEKTIEMGFREGFSMGLQNLDELLDRLTK